MSTLDAGALHEARIAGDHVYESEPDDDKAWTDHYVAAIIAYLDALPIPGNAADAGEVAGLIERLLHAGQLVKRKEIEVGVMEAMALSKVEQVIHEAVGEVERLTRERDEAKRRVKEIAMANTILAQMVSQEESQREHTLRREAKAQLATLRAQVETLREDGFRADDFEAALSPLLSAHEGIIQAGLSNNFNVIIAALRLAIAARTILDSLPAGVRLGDER